MPLTADAVAALAAKDLTLATAEATTAGLIGQLLTEIPGSSRVFRGGVAPYANALKQAIGVPASLLADQGAVSREAAEALATVSREWAGADIGFAETGIAGPGGAGPDRPGRPLLDRAGHCRRHSQLAIRLRRRPRGEASGVRGGGAENARRGAVGHLKRRAC